MRASNLARNNIMLQRRNSINSGSIYFLCNLRLKRFNQILLEEIKNIFYYIFSCLGRNHNAAQRGINGIGNGRFVDKLQDT